MSSEFVAQLLHVNPFTLKTLTHRAPRRYAIKQALALRDVATGSEYAARDALLKLWGLHGHHAPERSLITVMYQADLHNALKRLCLTERPMLAQRLFEIIRQLQGQPIDYFKLFDDIKFYGPGVQRSWTAEYLNLANAIRPQSEPEGAV